MIQNKDKGKEVSTSKQKSDPQIIKKPKIEPKEIEKTSTSFNLGNELNKIRIRVSLIEFAKNPMNRKKVLKMIDCSNWVTQIDTLNLHYENPIVMFGPYIEERGEAMVPFYITLVVHEHQKKFDLLGMLTRWWQGLRSTIMRS